MTITIREPGSALTHLAGIVLAAAAAIPMLIRAAMSGSARELAAMAVFMGSLLLLYTASTVYHSVTARASIVKMLRRLDHMMIFVLIAGSYTPICLLALEEGKGKALLSAVWGLALTGMALKACWVTCPRWFSSLIYIALGWACIFVLGDLVRALPAGGFFWLLAGGVVYTAGGVIYALKLPIFPQKKYFGNHELFHLFVLGGSICHFICMFCYLA